MKIRTNPPIEDWLEVVEKTQFGVETTYRFKENPLVEEGDNLAEHCFLMQQMATLAYPYLQLELKSTSEEDRLWLMLPRIAVHDLGEIEAGDIATFCKNDQTEEVLERKIIENLYQNLPQINQKFTLDLFYEYQNQDSQLAQIVKVFDRLAGNERCFKYPISIIHPDHGALSLQRVTQMLGVSSTTDQLIIYQISRMQVLREEYKSNFAKRNELAGHLSSNQGGTRQEVLAAINLMLQFDIKSYKGDRNYAYTPINSAEYVAYLKTLV
ncbi:HD domain-containing protein [bacterium]|nr:HD domain-containing protein [Candidatus Parcubacteria bacterium]NCT55767.1 HD domain-containing protein [bacterium]